VTLVATGPPKSEGSQMPLDQFKNKLARVFCAAVLLAIVAAATVLRAQNTSKSIPAKAPPDANATLRDLLKQRRDARQQRLDAVQRAFDDDRTTVEAVLIAEDDLLRAELDLATSPAERIACHEKLVEIRKNIERRVAALMEGGRRGGEAERYYGAVAARLEAEIGLQRERMNVNTQPARGEEVTTPAGQQKARHERPRALFSR